MRLSFISWLSSLLALWLPLCAIPRTSAQQLQINFYNDHWCGNYEASIEYYWADSMNSYGTNCYNYHYGNSLLIANCFSGSFCSCLFFYEENCNGDYATLQSTGYNSDSQWEWNCLFDANSFNSYRCYYY